MRKQLTCLILTVVFTITMCAGIELPGVYKPVQLKVTPQKMVLVFDRSAGLLLFQKTKNQPSGIGSFGQGPGEYGKSAFISEQDGKIYLSTRGKILIFDFQGNVAREVRHTLDLFRHRLMPLPESGWLADLTKTDYSARGGTIIRVCLLNSDFSIRKELYSRKIPLPLQEVRLFPFATGSVLAANRIITAAKEDNGSLRIFDLQGKPLGAVVIPKNRWRKPAPDEISARMEEYRKRAGDPAFWKELKKRVTVPDHIPNFLDFRAAAEGILVRTANLQDHKRLFLLFDLSGKFIREYLLPDAGPVYDFSSNSYHCLKTSEENNTRLHTLPLIRPAV